MPSYGPIRCSFHNKIWMSSSLLCVSVNVVDPYLVVVSACLRVLIVPTCSDAAVGTLFPSKTADLRPFLLCYRYVPIVPTQEGV
jgi:hypothetical protein